ncbi:MAG: OmpH family outer membrane protein [Armatimonadetes bacterium]|nr:OmpH family outer membrane protein [Armatimonadota bacterium]
MNTTRKLSAFGVGGWVVAFGLAAVIVGGAFQGGTQKFGVVDLERVIRESRLAGELQNELNLELTKRQDLLDFMELYMIMTKEEAEQLIIFLRKDAPTEEEKAAHEKVKQDIIAASAEYDRINGQTSPTEAERNTLQRYGRLLDDTVTRISEFGAGFQRELQIIEADAQSDAIKKAYDSSAAIAKRDGYTVVFSRSTAVYAANDVTEEVIAHVDSQ